MFLPFHTNMVTYFRASLKLVFSASVKNFCSSSAPQAPVIIRYVFATIPIDTNHAVVVDVELFRGVPAVVVAGRKAGLVRHAGGGGGKLGTSALDEGRSKTGFQQVCRICVFFKLVFISFLGMYLHLFFYRICDSIDDVLAPTIYHNNAWKPHNFFFLY